MVSKKIPEGELACSFLGYAVIGFFLIHTPPGAMAFAVAFAITAACARAWAMAIFLARVEAWAALLPLILVAAWAGIMTMAESGAGIVAGAFAGAISWFVFWAVGRRVAFTLDGQGLSSVPVVVVFAINGAVTWFVFGAVAFFVALAVTKSKFLLIAFVIAWVWAWTWSWFLFEFYTGVILGSFGWACLGVALGMQLEVIHGTMAWAWPLAGALAGSVSGAISQAGKELQKSFNQVQTFLFLIVTSLSGLGLGRLLSNIFMS
jgi:hypothetical protein